MTEAAASAASAGASQQATIRYGIYNQPGAYAGRTVADVRAQLATQWNIPSDAKPHKGKVVIEDNYVIQPNDAIDFHRQMGEKGVGGKGLGTH